MSIPKRAAHTYSGIPAMSGFSLIEMMISITIGLFIVAALIGVLVSSSGSSKTNERTSELQSNGRYAMSTLSKELRHAGFHAYTPLSNPIAISALAIGASASVPVVCGGNSNFVANIRQGIWGGDNSNPFAANCIPANYRANTDVLVIRRLADQATASVNGVANAVYFRSAYAQGNVFQFMNPVSVPTVAGNVNAENFELWQYIYYIGNDDTDATVPALRRVRLQTATDPIPGSMIDEMVVSGIEQLQVQYSIFNHVDGTTQYYNASGLTGASTDTVATEWDDVHAVRLWLLARNAKAEAGYANTTSYVMGNQIYTVNDSFRRQLFTTVVQLRN